MHEIEGRNKPRGVGRLVQPPPTEFHLLSSSFVLCKIGIRIRTGQVTNNMGKGFSFMFPDTVADTDDICQL